MLIIVDSVHSTNAVLVVASTLNSNFIRFLETASAAGHELTAASRRWIDWQPFGRIARAAEDRQLE
jgi:hypothetical protein